MAASVFSWTIWLISMPRMYFEPSRFICLTLAEPESLIFFRAHKDVRVNGNLHRQFQPQPAFGNIDALPLREVRLAGGFPSDLNRSTVRKPVVASQVLHCPDLLNWRIGNSKDRL